MKNKILIIAEAGVNHNGNLSLAKQLVDAAVNAGADYVKFQTFKAEKLVSIDAPKANYQIFNTHDGSESQFNMLKKLELSEIDHYQLIDYCKHQGIKFLSTAFDIGSLDFLKSLGIGLIKIPSGEITNLPYLQKVAEVAEEIVMSTGMSTMDEIVDAVSILQSSSTAKITILHCNTEYPTPFSDVNLLAMNGMRNRLSLEIGYSDHTLGIEVPIAAAALGATIIEKHFTLDRGLPGPDHAASLEPEELKAMVKAIRNVEMALGEDVKKTTESESKNRLVARKSIHLNIAKKKGDIIQESDIQMLRPGDGISPMKINDVIGRTIRYDLLSGHKLDYNDFE